MSRVAAYLFVVALPLTATAAPESYTFDPYHTFCHFAVSHGGYSTLWGRFDKTSGRITIDRAAKSGALEITIRTDSINTGDNERGSRPRSRDEHLRSADFLNVAEFPTMTYNANRLTFSGENLTTVEGQLTLLGVTRPLTLTVDTWKCGSHPVTRKEICGGNAGGQIKRSDFGMKFLPTMVGDDYKIFIEFEAYRD
jgi:polyisoprenoid-binding protein YceI